MALKQINPNRRRWLVLVLVIMVLLLSRSVWGVYQKNALARGAAGEVAAELISLETRQAALASKVAALETPRGQEEELRNNFPVAKDGEKVLVIINDEAANNPATTTPSFWDQLLAPFKQ